MTLTEEPPQDDPVQTLLLATIGSISYLRGFFDENNFDDQHYASEQPASSPPSINNDPPKKIVKFKTIKRGVSIEADRLLAYLVLPSYY
jgi:HORMA domain